MGPGKVMHAVSHDATRVTHLCMGRDSTGSTVTLLAYQEPRVAILWTNRNTGLRGLAISGTCGGDLHHDERQAPY